MARPRKPWYRKQNDAWYVEVDGKQVLLAKGKASKADAMQAYHRLMLEGGQQAMGAAPLTVAEVCDLFLEDVHRRLEGGEIVATTAEFYGRHLQSFAEHAGLVAANAVRPLHATGWLSVHQWSRGNRHGAITAIKAAFRWASRQGYLDADPFVNLKRPGAEPREAVMTAVQFHQILDGTKDHAWRDLLVVMWETGARPGEIAKVTAAELDRERRRLVFLPRRSKTGRKTGRPRIIHLTAAALEVCARWAEASPKGPIFRNLRGNPWTRNAMALRFRRIRERLGFGGEATAYALRHRFAMDALEASVPIATVSELLGHRDTLMVSRTYGHLSELHDHLQDAAAKVRPGGDPS